MRWRMKDSFEQSTLLAPKVRAFWDLTRPFTLLAPFIGGLMFGAMALLATDGISLTRETAFIIFHAGITLALLNAGGNAINQAAEADMDRVNKPYRAIPSGMATEHEAWSLGLLLWIAVVVRALWINWVFFGLVCVILISSYHYSLGLQLKRRYLLNNLTIAATRGFLGPLAAWSTIGNPLDPRILSVCAVFSAYTFGATVFKDLPDIEGDILHGARNFVTQHGPTWAVVIGGTFMLFSHVVLAAAVFRDQLPGVSSTYHLNIIITVVILSSALRSTKESAIENRWSWVLMYTQMMAMMMFFTGVFYFGI